MRVAVLGATGAVGRTMLEILESRGFDVDMLVPLASARSAGTRLPWRGRAWTVREPSAHTFDGCDLALFSAGAARSREWAPVAAAAGAVVIDNSSAWRMHADVPLVVPEVNARALERRPLGIIANPNCATIQLVVALEALRRAAGRRRVVATTFQSVSGAGQTGLDALAAELGARAGTGDAAADRRSASDGGGRGSRGTRAAGSPFVAAIAGNVIPWIGPRGDDGWNEEEAKIRAETRRILDAPKLAVAATCVRVPVAVGHAVAVAAELERPLAVADARAALAAMPGVRLAAPDEDPLPLDVAGRDEVHVGRVRVDPDRPDVLHLWVVADNLRKGAATNAVQIAEAVAAGRVASHG
jgi:aspartate-semialdehyde dehydrogenase